MQKDPAFENNPYLTVYPSIMDPGNGNGGGPDESDCEPCYQVNPPGWCNNPNHPCYNCCNPIPVEPGILGLGIMFAFGVALITKYNEKTESI